MYYPVSDFLVSIFNIITTETLKQSINESMIQLKNTHTVYTQKTVCRAFGVFFSHWFHCLLSDYHWNSRIQIPLRCDKWGRIFVCSVSQRSSCTTSVGLISDALKYWSCVQKNLGYNRLISSEPCDDRLPSRAASCPCRSRKSSVISMPMTANYKDQAKWSGFWVPGDNK